MAVIGFTDFTPEFAACAVYAGVALIEIDVEAETTSQRVSEAYQRALAATPNSSIISIQGGPNMVMEVPPPYGDSHVGLSTSITTSSTAQRPCVQS